MEYDEKILNYISKDENISQRQLAKLTDLSVGHLNFLLHKMVDKGLLTIERINSRNLRYILTPEGIAKNTKRVYSYVKNAVKQVLLLKNELETVFEHYGLQGRNIYIDKENDEIYEIVKTVVSANKKYCVKWLENEKEIDKDLKNDSANPVVLLWNAEKEKLYKKRGIEYVNLLTRIDSL